MSLFGELETTKSPYETFKFEVEGDFVDILPIAVGTRNGTHGEFKVLECVSFNRETEDIEEVKKSCKLISFPLKTWLMNAVDSGDISIGTCCRVKLTLKRGGKFIDKKTNAQRIAKSDNFEIKSFKILDDKTRQIIESFVPASGFKPYNEVDEDTAEPEVVEPKRPRL